VLGMRRCGFGLKVMWAGICQTMLGFSLVPDLVLALRFSRAGTTESIRTCLIHFLQKKKTDA
jgi:hypothetical protein